MDYSQFEIFRDITDREVEAMIRCFHMRQDAFQPGETICIESLLAYQVPDSSLLEWKNGYGGCGLAG